MSQQRVGRADRRAIPQTASVTVEAVTWQPMYFGSSPDGLQTYFALVDTIAGYQVALAEWEWQPTSRIEKATYAPGGDLERGAAPVAVEWNQIPGTSSFGIIATWDSPVEPHQGIWFEGSTLDFRGPNGEWIGGGYFPFVDPGTLIPATIVDNGDGSLSITFALKDDPSSSSDMDVSCIPNWTWGTFPATEAVWDSGSNSLTVVFAGATGSPPDLIIPANGTCVEGTDGEQVIGGTYRVP